MNAQQETRLRVEQSEDQVGGRGGGHRHSRGGGGGGMQPCRGFPSSCQRHAQQAHSGGADMHVAMPRQVPKRKQRVGGGA